MPETTHPGPESDAEHTGLPSIDPVVLQAAAEVDQSLLDWMLSLSPLERLRASSNATRALARFKNVAPGTR